VSRRASPPGKARLAHGWSTASERPYLTLLPDHRHLKRPRLTADPAVPSSPPHAAEVHAPPPQGKIVSSGILPRKKHIGRAEREILAPVLHRNYLFKSLMDMAFPIGDDPADRAVGPLSPRAKTGTATGFPPLGGEGMPTGLRAHPPPGPRHRERHVVCTRFSCHVPGSTTKKHGLGACLT
jgi:hypothetical protein